ncbi:tetratricopeptide repeat protein [Zoogloea sp.]|uniref:tetratricopeptide repeat protein n=1 Tax=Zoogloea sp. TaxID=49181 RepID=UPI0035B0D644
MSSNNEAALQRLANALALGDGFQFHILVCHSPLQVGQSLTTLAEAIPALRGGSLITRPLLPATFSPDKPLDSALTAAVTEGLSTLPPPAADERVLAVLDASFVAETEIPAWRQLFRRLNEQRNAVADQVDAALLLCLSPTLEPIFAHEAPDFWSIRGVSVRLEAEAQPTLPSSQFIQAAPSAEISLAPLASTADELPALRQAVEALRQRASANPDNLDIRHTLVIQLGRLGDAMHRSGCSLDAVQAYLESRDILEQLIAAKPDIASLHANLAVAFERLGEVMTALGQGEDAREYFLKALAIGERLALAEPQHTNYQRNLSVVYNKLGDLMTSLGHAFEAHEYFEKALDIREQLAQVEPQHSIYQRDLSVSYNRLGALMVALGKSNEASDYIAKALAIAQRLAQAEPQRADYQRDLSVSCIKLGDLMTALGKGDEARDYFLKALDIAQRLAQAEPQRADYQRDLSVSYNKLGDLMTALGKGDEARDYFLKALDIAQRLAQAEPQRADYQRDLIVSLVRIAQTDPAHAVEHLRHALDIARALKTRGLLVEGLDEMIAGLQAMLAQAGPG